MLSFSCMGKLRYFSLILSEILHLPIVLRCLFEASVFIYCIMYLPNPHQAFHGDRGTDLGTKSSENPFPCAVQQIDGRLKHCLFLGSFSPAVSAILLLAQPHWCGLLLLWMELLRCPFGARPPGLAAALHSWPSATE